MYGSYCCESLLLHWRDDHIGNEVVYRCKEEGDDCDFETIDEKTMKSHIKEHLFKRGEMYQCETCSKYFRSLILLENHNKKTHEKIKRYTCDICQEMFHNKQTMSVHKAKVHDISDGNHYSCEVCGHIYPAKCLLEDHVRIHTNERPFSCNLCGQSFAAKQRLKLHIKAHKLLCKCDKCEMCFKTDKQLRSHQHKEHDKPYKYYCSQCPAKYNVLSQFKTHQYGHTGEMPFECAVCGKRFRAQKNLYRHSLIHGEDKYRYPCKHCNSKFTQSGNLKTHMKSHHPEALY